MRPRAWLEQTGGFLDEVLGVVAPRLALRRQMARDTAYMLSLYRGGRTERPRSNWITGAASPDDDVLPDLETQRARSRELVANSDVARAILSRININTVGRGLVPQAAVDAKTLRISDDRARDFNDTAEAIWRDYVPEIDAEGEHTAYTMQGLANWAEMESGGVFLVRQQNPDNIGPIKTTWRVLEADRVGQPPKLAETARLRAGIERDAQGRVVAYWIKDTHPGDLKYGAGKSDDYRRVPKRDHRGRLNVIHLHHPTRPSQRRSPPLLAPVLPRFHDIERYIEAEVVGARVQACQAVFVESEHPDILAKARTADMESDPNYRVERLEPGRMIYGRMGEKPHMLTPQRPGAQFDIFIERIIKSITAGAANLPYECVMLDFWRRNYSQTRGANLEAREGCYLPRRAWLVECLCQVQWDLALEEAYLNGDYPADGFYQQRRAYTRSYWLGPAFRLYDPEKESKGVANMMRLGLTTWQRELLGQNLDIDETAAQIAREKELRKTAGLPPLDQLGSKPNA